jgi:hypothetical protein
MLKTVASGTYVEVVEMTRDVCSVDKEAISIHRPTRFGYDMHE